MLSISVPPLGESIVEATITRWLRREGDRVGAGETLLELETDKVTVEVPAPKAGVVSRRARAEGDIVRVGELLGELDDSAASVPAAAAQPAAPSSGQSTGFAPSRVTEPLVFAPPPPQGSSPMPDRPAAAEVKASPAARRLADEVGVDLGRLVGTGRGGVVSKPDVVEQSARPMGYAPATTAVAPTRVTPPAAAPAVTASPAPAEAPVVAAPPSAAAAAEAGGRETREKMSTRRRRIAEHLLESQHATAHLTTFNEIDLTAVESLRARIKERVEKEHGVRLSMMPFFVKAACMALRQFPVVNARIDGDHIVYHHYVNMGIAVASDAGLVVPNLRGAESMGMIDIAKAIVAVAKKARDGKLTMEDLTGGTFTITNGGVFGSLVSTPIINFPQVGILGLHKLQDRPMAIDGQVVIRPMMYVALSYDHRIIDGQQAVLFLVRVKELMEDPGLMAVD